MRAEIVQLLVSPVHRFAGRPTDGPVPLPESELVDRIEIRARLGIVGDRYFGAPAHRDASVTIAAAEHLPPGADLRHTRRNILVRGLDVDAYVGNTLTLDSGLGAVTLLVHRPARPCGWLDTTMGTGTRKALFGKGGVRCEPLTDGVLTVGPVTATVD